MRGLLAKHPRVHLMWSGGIDTTAIVVAFMNELGAKEYPLP